MRLFSCFLCVLWITSYSLATAEVMKEPDLALKASPKNTQTIEPENRSKDFSTFLEDYNERIKKFQTAIVEAQNLIKKKDNDTGRLENLKEKLKNYAEDILEAGVSFRTPLNDINTQILQIDGKDAQTQEKLVKEKAQINTLMRQLEDNYSAIFQLDAQISAHIREMFTRSLTHHVQLDTALRQDIINSGEKSFTRFFRIIQTFWHDCVENRLPHFFISFLLPAVIALLLSRFGTRFLHRFSKATYEEYKNTKAMPHFSIAFFSVFVPLFSWSIFFLLCWGMLSFFGIFNDDVEQIFKAFSIEAILILFIYHIAKAIFAPRKPALQLISIAPASGSTLVFLITALASVIGLDDSVNTIYKVVQAPFSLSVFKSLITIFLVSALLTAIAFMLPFRSWLMKKGIRRPSYLQICSITLALIPIFVALFGYVGLARYIVQQYVVSGAFLCFLYLGFLTSRHIAQEGAFEHSFIGRALKKYYVIKQPLMNQLGLATGFFINILALMICLPPILMQMGFSAKEIFSTAKNFFTGFQIGNISISLISIFLGIFIFLISLFIIRRFIAWFDETVMLRSKIDSGVRNSIRTVLRYIAFALAVLIGLSVAGFNLSSLAIIAGGLSLGIGFGLQNIVQNFVSGLIILAERPFKVGDYIESGTASGIVKHINVRATEVETLKKETIIVPNSSFINSNVSNWTRHNRIGRVDLPITVPTKQDPEKIHNMLMKIAQESEYVLKNPAPYVSFTNFDKTNFTFTLNVYLLNIISSTEAVNHLKYEIYRALNKEGIFE